MSDNEQVNEEITEMDNLEDVSLDKSSNFGATTEELSNVMENIKVEVTDEDKEKYGVKKKRRSKKDQPTNSELSSMTDKEVEDSLDSETKDLYLEFNSFLEDKAKIHQDTGVKEVVPTGIDVLDAVLGGGFALGTISMVCGRPGSGKTMLAIQAMASAQRKWKDKVLVSFLDSEESTTTLRMSNLGVKSPRIKPYNDITVEKVFKFLETLCMYKEMKNMIDMPAIVVWDSVANTLSQKEREIEDVNQAMGYKARILSWLIPKYVSKLANYNISLIAINQLRDDIKIGPFSSPKEVQYISSGKTIPGGNALKFNSFHLLEARVKETLKPEKYGFDGVKVIVNCAKNKLFPPNNPIEVIGNFVTGFSNFWTNFEFLVEHERVNTGSWNTLVSDPKQTKFRTRDAETMYNSNPEFKAAFDHEAMETIQKEIIDKNIVEI